MKQSLIKVSNSALLNINQNYSAEQERAYIMLKELSALFQHPILLNYQANITAIRILLGYSDSTFRKLIKVGLRSGFCRLEGNHLRSLSNTQDKKFKRTSKNDYNYVADLKTHHQKVLLSHHNKKQHVRIKQKDHQLSVKGSEFYRDDLKNTMDTYSNRKNYSVTLSVRAVSKLFKLNSTSKASRLIEEFIRKDLIKLTKQKIQITRQEFDTFLKKGIKNIRYDKQSKSHYMVLASEFELKYNIKHRALKPILTKFDRLPEKQQQTYLEMYGTKDNVNRMLNKI